MDAGEQDEPATPRRIDLVREGVRHAGALEIDPPRRTVRHRDGRSVILEPRAMQLLVALIDADGAILSREDLIHRCWDGRIVGDDSISSVVYRLRRDLRDIAAGEIEIATVTKVGFQLVVHGGTQTHSDTGAPAGLPPVHAVAARQDQGASSMLTPRRVGLIGAMAVFVALLGALGWWQMHRPEAVSRPIAIAPVTVVGPGIGPATTAAIADTLRGALSELGVPLAAGDGDLRLSVSLRRRGEALDLTARLDDMAAGRTLWNQTRTIASAEDAILGGEARRMANVVHCGEAALDEDSAPDLAAMVFRVCEADDRGIALARARELRAAAPDFAPGLMLLASSAATVVSWNGADAQAARREGLEATDRLIAMRPDQADGYVYQALLTPFDQPTRREELLRRAARQPSSYCDCAAMFLGDFLAQGGRLREAVALYQQGYEHDQVAPLPLLRLILGRDWLGETAQADALLGTLEAAHGPNPGLRYAHLLYSPSRPSEPAHPTYADPDLEHAVVTALRATSAGNAQERAAAAGLLRALPVTRQNEFPIAALLAELGDGEGALAVLETSLQAGNSFAGPGRYPGVTTALLWDPRLATVWRAPEFARYLARAGYFDYWRSSRSRPDVCRTEGQPPFCSMIEPAGGA